MLEKAVAVRWKIVTTTAALVAALTAGAQAVPAGTTPSARSVSGTIEVQSADGAPGSDSDGGVRVLLHHGGQVDQLPDSLADRVHTGEQVQVSGAGRVSPATHGSTASASGSSSPAVSASRGPLARKAPPRRGTNSVYVIRAYWTRPDSTTASTVRTRFSEAARWFTEVSYGVFTIQTTAGAGWRRIADPRGCGFEQTDAIWSRAVRAEEAANRSFRPTQYDHVVVYYPRYTACEFAGLGDVSGQRVWLNGTASYFTSLETDITTHELGHNIGLYHAHSVACRSGSTYVTDSSTCDDPNEYGDTSDVMGSSDDFYSAGGYVAAHYSAAQKQRLGWLGRRLATVAPCATYTLSPYEAGVGTVAMRFAGSDARTRAQDTFWLEWRRSTGVDTGLPTGMTDGVILHRTASTDFDPGPSLLDGTPATHGRTGFEDAAVPSGTTVSTPDGVRITVGAAAGGELPVTLTTARPSAPYRVAGTLHGRAVALSWSAPTCPGTQGLARYDVQVSANNSRWVHVAYLGASSTHATFNGLTPGVAYRFRVGAASTNEPAVFSAASVGFVAHRDTSRIAAAAASALPYGSAQHVRATLTDTTTGQPLAGRTMTLQRRYGSGAWARLTTATTDRLGRVDRTVRPTRTIQYRWLYAGSATVLPAQSARVTTTVLQVVHAAQTATSVGHGHAVAIFGTVDPARSGEKVKLQTYRNGTWVDTSVPTTTSRQRLPDGRVRTGFVLRYTPRGAGTVQLRVWRWATSDLGSAVSRTLTLHVS